MHALYCHHRPASNIDMASIINFIAHTPRMNNFYVLFVPSVLQLDTPPVTARLCVWCVHCTVEPHLDYNYSHLYLAGELINCWESCDKLVTVKAVEHGLIL